MNTRPGTFALERLLRLGSAAEVTLLALSACAVGSAGQRPGAATAPVAPAAVTPVAPVPPEQAPPPAPPQAGEAAPSDVSPPTPQGAPPLPAPTPTPTPTPQAAPSGVAPVNGAADEKMLPPCVPVRRARIKHHKPKPPPPPVPAPTGPPPPPPADAVVDAQVGEVGTSLSSILGKDVKSPKGEDLGRVVDVLADERGHVRVAIIDFGGFLGVGTRRIAVDWPLLRFDPASHDKPLVLSVDRRKLQSAPEYNSNRPRVLMPPAAPDAPDAGQTQK